MSFQPPPTWALPVLVDERTQKSIFNPIWLKWFVDLTSVISSIGSGGTAIAHNSLTGIQGGGSSERYHLTAAQNGGTFAALAGGTVQATNVAGFKSSDGSAGYTGTITTASLVGKTVTIKDGIITGIA